MIDLHIHTLHSDGSNTTEEILKMAEEEKLKLISITDHDTTKAYDEIKTLKHLFTGDIKNGIEMTTSFLGNRIEILGYDFDDYKLINRYFENFYNNLNKEKICGEIRIKLVNLLDEMKIKFDRNLINEIETLERFEKEVYESMIANNCNLRELLADEYVESAPKFFRERISNPNSKFYLDYTILMPNIDDVINLIHQNNGKVFLAHPFVYGVDLETFLPKIIEMTNLDGIECYHVNASKEQTSYLNKFAKEKGLLRSGGSDFHGHLRNDYKIGKVMHGKEKIEDNITNDWR